MNEENTKKPRWLSYVICLGIGLAFTAVYFITHDIFAMEDAASIVKCFSDGFFLSGFLLLCVWALVFVKRRGAFDALSYAGTYCLHSLIPDFGLRNKMNQRRTPTGYYDYCKERREKEKEKGKSMTAALIVGGGYLSIAIIITVVYMIWLV